MPLRIHETGIKPGEERSFISLEPDNLLISAIKKTEERKSIIVRIFNPTDRNTSGVLNFLNGIKKAKLVQLNEKPVKNIKIKKNQIKFKIGPFQIISIEIYPK